MIDVEAGLTRPSDEYRVHKLLECALLVYRVQRPPRTVDEIARLVHLAEPEQVVVASLAHEACAFEIQEQIGLRGFWQTAQSFPGDYRESSHHRLPARALLALDLRLLDDAIVGFLGPTRRLERDRD